MRTGRKDRVTIQSGSACELRRAACSRQIRRENHQADILILPLVSWFGGDKPPFSISNEPAYFSCFLSYSSFVITLIASSFLPASFALSPARSFAIIASS